MLKISDFYLDKQKGFIPKKISSVPWIALFSANRWRLDIQTFLIKGFDANLYVVVRDDEQGSEYQGILPNSETLLTLKVKMEVV